MFPPGNAAAADALAGHLRYRRGPLRRYVGPLLVHVDRLDEVAETHAALGEPTVDVVIIGTHRLSSANLGGLRVVGFETPVTDMPLPQTSGGLPLACEVSPDADGLRVLEAIAVARANGIAVVGKLRTGGTELSAFPDEQTVARVVADAVRLSVPLKFTAGLHHAVRFTGRDTGFEHHGFLNLLAATDAAQRGAAEEALADLLRVRDGGVLAASVAQWGAADAARVRQTFVSFGCCGVEAPLRDLADLGLIPADTSLLDEEST